jgi:hypothetical protein
MTGRSRPKHAASPTDYIGLCARIVQWQDVYLKHWGKVADHYLRPMLCLIKSIRSVDTLLNRVFRCISRFESLYGLLFCYTIRMKTNTGKKPAMVKKQAQPQQWVTVWWGDNGGSLENVLVLENIAGKVYKAFSTETDETLFVNNYQIVAHGPTLKVPNF